MGLKQCLAASLLVSMAMVASAEATCVRGKIAYKTEFDESYALNRDNIREFIDTFPTAGSISTSRALNSLILMHENASFAGCDNNTYYMKEAVAWTLRIIGKAQITRDIAGNLYPYKDGYKGWINFKHESNASDGASVLNTEIPLNESYLFRPIVRILSAIHADAGLRTAYSSQYATILAFTEKHIWAKWYSRSMRIDPCYPNQIFRGRTHMASQWGSIAAHLYRLTADTVKKAQYADLITTLSKQIRWQLKTDSVKDAYRWNSSWDNPWPYGTKCEQAADTDAPQDFVHANHVINFVVDAYEQKIGGWTLDHLEKFTNTYTKIFYNPTKLEFYETLEGKPFVAGGNPANIYGAISPEGWMRLAQYSLAAHRVNLKMHTSRILAVYDAPRFLYRYQYASGLGISEKRLIERCVADIKANLPPPLLTAPAKLSITTDPITSPADPRCQFDWSPPATVQSQWGYIISPSANISVTAFQVRAARLAAGAGDLRIRVKTVSTGSLVGTAVMSRSSFAAPGTNGCLSNGSNCYQWVRRGVSSTTPIVLKKGIQYRIEISSTDAATSFYSEIVPDTGEIIWHTGITTYSYVYSLLSSDTGKTWKDLGAGGSVGTGSKNGDLPFFLEFKIL